MDIKKKDLEGEPVNVCTGYDVHTISLVKTNALGINVLRAKSEGDPNTEEMKILTDKIEKAKAKDEKEAADKANLELIEKAKAAEDVSAEITEEPVDEKSMVESEPVEKAKAEDETLPAIDQEDTIEVDSEKEEESVEKSKSEEIADEEISDVGSTEKTIEKSKSEEVSEEGSDDEDKIEKAKAEDEESESNDDDDEEEEGEGEPAKKKEEKSKSFSVEELGESHRAALSAIGDLFKRVKGGAPDASHWEIFDIIYDAVWAVDDIMWFEKQELENQIWEEVSKEVSARIEKSKALEIKEASDPVDVMKALEQSHPEMAKIISAEIASNKAKAADAEAAKNAVIRQKALESGSQMFKRIATEDNTTDNIVDALSTIEVAAPEAHNVVSKALTTASNILQAGELFPDVGSSQEAQHQDKGSYVEEKSKALVEDAESKGETLNPAAARATVRQSAEYVALFG